ncbi:MAG: polysaccharide deacetylase family protein [Nitriliruptoraceae bacterium]
MERTNDPDDVTPRARALGWRASPRGVRPLRIWSVALVLTVLLGACAGDATEEDGGDADADTEVAGDDADDADDPSQDPVDEDPEADLDGDQDADEVAAAPPVDPAEVGADELGTVPVLMYHRLLEDGGGDYDLTAEQFRGELEWLFDNGYIPVHTRDLARGEIDIPAGTSPVVLTFDDSTREQAWLTEDGELHPDSAIGILIEVAGRYEDVEPAASLYVITSSLFGGGSDGPDVLAALHEAGMEIGNHTHNHPNLSSLSGAEVQHELALNVATVRELVDGAEVDTLSLPLGIFPEDRSLAVTGSSEAGDYAHDGILLVGAEPAPSPFAPGFDPAAIPRVRSSPSWDGGDPDWGSAFWLEQLDGDGDRRRYVSDGDPDTISFPSARADELDPTFTDRANPY